MSAVQCKNWLERRTMISCYRSVALPIMMTILCLNHTNSNLNLLSIELIFEIMVKVYNNLLFTKRILNGKYKCTYKPPRNRSYQYDICTHRNYTLTYDISKRAPYLYELIPLHTVNYNSHKPFKLYVKYLLMDIHNKEYIMYASTYDCELLLAFDGVSNHSKRKLFRFAWQLKDQNFSDLMLHARYDVFIMSNVNKSFRIVCVRNPRNTNW